MTTSTKHIQAHHLERQAIIYIRQSTLVQVRDNWASRERQYSLTKRAQDLGWSSSMIKTIDQDQGQSGATSQARDGFQYIVAEVGLQQVGAVFCLEASRLARSNSDWYRLLEICALTDTLVIDEDGIYDPGQYNDRLLLGFKGTMSEAELHWLRQRLRGGSLAKAQKGKLRFQLPVGFVHTPAGEIIFDPHEDVQAAVQLVFDVFERAGKATAVVKHFHQHNIQFPSRQWGGVRDGEIRWGPLYYQRVLSILHNPCYAGTYVYGRTKQKARLPIGVPPRIKPETHRIPRSEWLVFIPDSHPGYISWEQYLKNEKRLDANRCDYSTHRRGAAREGRALLQGIAICGYCGKRMTAQYNPDGVPHYQCNAGRAMRIPTCQSLKGDYIDEAITKQLFDALQPAQLQIALQTVEQVEDEVRQIERQWDLQIERAQYEADLAQRRFVAVEPENRLVARTLETDWNTKLAQLETLKQEHTSHTNALPVPLTEQEQQAILNLAQDLPVIWHAQTTTNAQRKQLLRLLIADVTIRRHDDVIDLGIHWQTNAITELTIPRLKNAMECFRTDPRVITRIRELAPGHTDWQIADQLNAEGFQSGRGGPFNKVKVVWLRKSNSIPSGCPDRPVRGGMKPRGDGRLPTAAVARMIGVTPETITRWCREGKLDFIQANRPRAPYWIAITPEEIEHLRQSISS